MTNLADLARQVYPPQHRCPCGVIVREVGGRWTDGAGVTHCWGGQLAHTVLVTPSPLIDPAVELLRGLL